MNWTLKMNRPLKRIVLAVALVALAACETVQTTQGGVVGVNRPQKMAVSSAEINQAAGREYAQLIEGERRKGELNPNPAQTQRVRAIAAKLIRQTTVFRQDAAGWAWETNVIADKDVNAWCMPGGKIAVYSGLIEKLHATDDELAAVIGHEIAHALREHARERISEQMFAGFGASIVDAIGSAYGVRGLGRATSTGFQLFAGLPHSREQEVEADRIGVELAARAGYDPRAAVTLWEKMGSSGGAEPPEFLSTHPSPRGRLQDLRVYSQRVLPLYEEAKRRR
ncbi:MAG TPA: M48 family metallopeptidase [Paucimonas sp.]|nr:M48 family metallopeptidase [Paucimonas sp.]